MGFKGTYASVYLIFVSLFLRGSLILVFSGNLLCFAKSFFLLVSHKLNSSIFVSSKRPVSVTNSGEEHCCQIHKRI